jgi:hypothetical protein
MQRTREQAGRFLESVFREPLIGGVRPMEKGREQILCRGRHSDTNWLASAQRRNA